MKPFIFLSVLPLLTSARHQKHCCLCASDVTSILKNYNAAFDSTGPENNPAALKALYDKTFKENVIVYTETFNNGASEIGSTNKTQILDSQLAYIGVDVPSNQEKFETVYTFHTCNQIAYRWQLDSVVTTGTEVAKGVKLPLNKTAYPPGSKISYKGVDLIEVDCHDKLIKKVYSSADLQNYLNAIGVPPQCPPV